MPTTYAADIEICYERSGAGPRLLFISGTGGDLRNTPNVFDGPLPKQFDTLAYDQRGLGRSAKPDRPYTMADYADDAAHLMDAIGWNEALVVGVSFGGMVAQEFALRHARRVRRLVLCCTSPGGAGGASYPLHTIEHLSRADRARRMIPISDTRHDAAWAKANPDAYEKLFAMASADPFADEPGHVTGQHRQLEARAHHDTWNRLKDITCPTMIAAGRYDGIATPATQEKMASRIPDAHLRFYEGGHLFLLQDRNAFPEIIAFLKP
ncbi:MAG: alpha/beta fold hydrolase [Alphaproteobacteria bacterium]|nr:alpha/beta fold hydrolase [Alphaproteobacteria bacterium]